MAEIKEIEIFVNEEIVRIAKESNLIIEQFQKLLGVYTTTGAFGKIAVLMREDDALEKMLVESNDLLRSAYSIALREGEDTNWDAFRAQLKKALDTQHENGIFKQD